MYTMCVVMYIYIVYVYTLVFLHTCGLCSVSSTRISPTLRLLASLLLVAMEDDAASAKAAGMLGVAALVPYGGLTVMLINFKGIASCCGSCIAVLVLIPMLLALFFGGLGFNVVVSGSTFGIGDLCFLSLSKLDKGTSKAQTRIV